LQGDRATDYTDFHRFIRTERNNYIKDQINKIQNKQEKLDEACNDVGVMIKPISQRGNLHELSA
jgi:uncharacterized protein YydD (DUF2326 family)